MDPAAAAEGLTAPDPLPLAGVRHDGPRRGVVDPLGGVVSAGPRVLEKPHESVAQRHTLVL